MVLSSSAPCCPPSSRPRACGDGPTYGECACGCGESAPRLRGWSSGAHHPGSRRPVGPAPAGMVRSASAKKPSAARRPRACGDGPRVRPEGRLLLRSAPRLRGWSELVLAVDMRWHVGPAPAGMVRGHPAGRRGAPSRPRACGDGPWPGIAHHDSETSAPRLRGWSAARAAAAEDPRVGPAPAGMVPRFAKSLGKSSRRPRACGDGPVDADAKGAVGESAPRLRGWSVIFTAVGWVIAVGPAPAGMVRSGSTRSWPTPCRPRACGDGPRLRRYS